MLVLTLLHEKQKDQIVLVTKPRAVLLHYITVDPENAYVAKWILYSLVFSSKETQCYVNMTKNIKFYLVEQDNFTTHLLHFFKHRFVMQRCKIQC
jgi:hypothetical protein